LAGSARSARSARSAWSARSALDYDFDWYVFEFEYCKNPDKEYPPKKEDSQYLEYCELLMQAKEYGMGYRVEWEDTLYCVPTPLVCVDEQNRFHSEIKPAIFWKGGKKFYFLKGISFPKDLWQKIVNHTITPKEAMELKNAEQRAIAMRYIGYEKLLKETNAKQIGKDEYGEIIELDILDINNDKLRYYIAIDPSKNEKIALLVSPDTQTPKEAMTKYYHLDILGLEYKPDMRT
jgi:hypothetical protein